MRQKVVYNQILFTDLYHNVTKMVYHRHIFTVKDNDKAIIKCIMINLLSNKSCLIYQLMYHPQS